MFEKMIALFWIILFNFDYIQIEALQMTAISVPEVADYRDNVTLSCTYDMGKHTLNSVKWYKDNAEFFRYAPLNSPSIMKFIVDGVTLAEQYDICNRETCSVHIQQLQQRSSGEYRCEISGDAPEFKLISETANMTVAALPQHDPIISGLSRTYAFGDFVQANCTSDQSSPPAKLTWFINDIEQPPAEYMQPQQETTIRSNGYQLRYRSTEIRFIIDQTHFGTNVKSLDIKCVAHIEQFPSLQRRECNHKVFVGSQDDLNNQKLVNWRTSNGGQLLRIDLLMAGCIGMMTLVSICLSRWLL